MNLSTVTWVWTLLALVGLVAELLGLFDSIEDLRWVLHGPHVKVRMLIARGTVRTAVGRCVVLGVFALIGLLELFGGLVWPTLLISIIVTVGFFVSSGTLVAISLFDRVDRRALLKMSESIPENERG